MDRLKIVKFAKKMVQIWKCVNHQKEINEVLGVSVYNFHFPFLAFS